MLKFKFTRGNNNLDNKVLEVTETELSNDPIYDLPEGDFNTVNEITDKSTYTFTVKDLYGIQYGSHINSFNSVVVGNDDDGTKQEYHYYKEFVVQSADKENKIFSIYVDNELQLSVSSISIETRYNVMYYSDNQWHIQQVDRGWIDDECDNFDDIIWLQPNQVGYGKNPRQVYDINDKLTNEYTVFYYENDSWKTLTMLNDKNDDLEKCLSGGYISFNSFHNYDETSRAAVKMNAEGQNNLYYTHENYITINVSPTHYFSDSIEEYATTDDGLVKTTEYGRSVVKTMNYPYIYVYANYMESGSVTSSTLKIKKDVHIDGNSVISFNYDNFTHDFSNENDVADKDTEPIYPIVIETKESSSLTLEKLLKNDTKETIYRRLTTDEISVIEDKLFPYGYEIETIDKFGHAIKNNTSYEIGKVFGVDEYYHIYQQDGVVGNVKIKRDNFMFGDGVSSTFTYDTAVNIVQIPISQKFETDLHHNDALQTNYVDNAKKNAINPIVDMEKDVYTPAISKNVLSNDKQINSEYVDAYKIIFNLHFRKHRDTTSTSGTTQEWSCAKDAYWNGTKENKDASGKFVLELRPKVSEKKDNGYFSYEDASYQSDLLSFLGFANDDIKYQKSKLKKSFLRVSFYDSENIGNQNLLCTSTIFLDSGNLFAKYIKNIETVDSDLEENDDDNIYMATIGSSFVENDTAVSYGNSGVRVNREPQWNSTKGFDFGDNVDEWEDLRLSSQFVVTDKYSSKNSSEGFYFYTYRTNDNGVYPSDIYMRVEFNHAGYGRTIPFMMPYVRENERKTGGTYEGQTKIKSFEEICNDWSTVDEDKNPKDDNDIGYGSVKYVKYTHIKWKYRYDKGTQKHIYYLDPEQYGESVTSNNGNGHNIILNLYEGKIR